MPIVGLGGWGGWPAQDVRWRQNLQRGAPLAFRDRATSVCRNTYRPIEYALFNFEAIHPIEARDCPLAAPRRVL